LRTYSEPHSMIPCSECNIGQMHKTNVTYFTWLNGEMITVPDFPAWVCDICGKREYDHEAINQLALLLSPASEVNRARVRSARQSEQARDKQRTSPIE
jgi:YgiT-type zinc finger domain-containing protein